MTDVVLNLVPQYGLYLIFGVVFLACLAVPLPSSMLVLASGSFAATEDLVLWQVMAVTFAAFVLGDQVAFHIANRLGPKLLAPMRDRARFARAINKSEAMLEQRGGIAVLLSHTILSPTCPYVSFLCGAGGLKWITFSVTAVIGALIWTSAYVGLGYSFASQLSQVTDLISDFIGIILAGAFLFGSFLWLRAKWRAHAHKTEAESKA